MRTAEQTALLIALLFKRSEHGQVRLDMDTVRHLSRRRHIRSAFVKMLARHLDALGLILMERDAGGFGLLASSALEGAPAVTVKQYLANDLDKLEHGELGFDDLRDELGDGTRVSKDSTPKAWLRLVLAPNSSADARG